MNNPDDSTHIVSSADDGSDAELPERLSLAIVEEAGDWSAFEGREQTIEAVTTAVGKHPQVGVEAGDEATVVLANDTLVRDLNRTFRGKDKATNVLSFPFQAPPGLAATGMLGDIILAAETVQREAAERAIPPNHHLQHLVLHGLLHLFGFDHETDPEAAEMERLETEILASIGVADPHASSVGCMKNDEQQPHR